MPIIEKGDKYNRLTAIKFSHKNKNNTKFWLFKCDCGVEKIINVSNVKNGNTKSCGCLAKEIKFKHKMYGTKTYGSWVSMKERCLNKNHKQYKYYGDRGITVCKRWMKFENFYKDMEERPENKTLDRINNNEGYSKKNCRWATIKEQNNNKRNNVFLTYQNKTQTVSQWAEELNINRTTICARIERGWSIEKTLTIHYEK